MDLLALVFFASGATSLVYQSIWARELHLVFGTSQLAIATVLAAFMCGLAAGGAWMTRRIGSVERPLRRYALLEACIGVYALAFPLVMRALEPGYLAIAREGSGPLALGLAQFVLLGAALMLPTAAMGATLPLLVKHLRPTEEDAGRAVGRLYALNTAGAVAGTWLAGFWLLPELGVRGTTVLTAGGNLLLAGVALALDRTREAPAPRPLSVAAGEIPLPRSLLAIAAIVGLASLCLEVAWFRLLGLVLGASTYAFTVMLLAFLVGIAAGGAWGGRLADRCGSPARVHAALALVLAAIAGTTWVGTWGYGWLPLLFAKLWFFIDGDAGLMWPMKCVLAGAVMFLPALGMGAAFPLLVRAATRGDAARSAGGIYAANTLGSVLGAFLGGFVLLPSLRVSGTVLLCCALYVAAALLAWRAAAPSPGRLRLAGAGALLAGGLAWAFPAPWNPMLMTSGIYKYIDNLEAPTMAALRARMLDKYELLHYEEGLSTVVTVAKDRETGNIWLANNGKIDASTTADMPTQVLVAHLPWLFLGEGDRPPPKRTALIGLASGITLGALTLHPDAEQIDVVELEPSMPTAARLFSPWNHASLDDPRVRLIANDGRNHLVRTPPGTYDLIVSEPSNPWLTGVSNLFTREFFEMGKSRLAPGGIWSQWVQMYGLDLRDLRAVMRTFAEV
jgi:spermidine synthase